MRAELYGDDLPELVETLAERVAAHHESRPFYQELYDGAPEIETLDDFRDLPVLRKQDFMGGEGQSAVFFDDGVADDPRHVITTSGTSGQIAICKKSETEMDVEYDLHSKTMPPGTNRRALILLNRSFIYNVRHVLYDRDWFNTLGKPDDPAFSRELVMSLDVDTLIGTPSLVMTLGRLLKDAGHDMSSIQDLAMTGEMVSPVMETELQDLYPDANIVQFYGNTETSFVAYQCEEGIDRNTYHLPTDHHFIEVIDPDTGEPCDVGEEGELVVTPLWADTCTPVIRYGIGDRVVVREATCCDDTDLVLELRGRLAFDQVKLNDVVVYRENFEEALEALGTMIAGEYLIHVDEEDVDGDVVPTLRVEVVPRRDFRDPSAAKRDMARKIMTNFQITTDYTWSDGVDDGVFGPITVDFVNADDLPTVRTNRIIDHRGE